MKILFKIMIALLVMCCVNGCQKEETAKIKIGIVLPLEHKALQEIVSGFTQKIHEIYPEPVQIKVMNAQGDVNLQRAILQQMRDQDYAMIVPVATSVTQMASSIIRDKPIIGLAANMLEKDRQELHPCHIDVVDDEIPPQKILGFIHAAYPNLNHLVLVHSASDKVLPDVNIAVQVGKKLGIEVKPVMVATLPELVSAAQSLSSQTQGIFILKDNLIASGISTLINVAREKQIPLVTSDQGTMQMGAGMALGVHEHQIGAEGAKLAAQVLQGKPICELPIMKMQNLTVFLNKKALQQEGQPIESIVSAALKLHYIVEIFGNK